MTMTTHKTHESLPAGFTFADRLQVESFMATGSVNGASKVVLVAGPGELPRLACRLRPARHWTAEQRHEYQLGWSHGKAAQAVTAVEGSRYAFGYRDAAENRMKWHLAYCADHGDHESGCRA